MKGNNKGFFRCVCNKRKTGKNVGYLLNGVGELVTKEAEKTKILNVFFVSVLSGKTSFRNPRP